MPIVKLSRLSNAYVRGYPQPRAITSYTMFFAFGTGWPPVVA